MMRWALAMAATTLCVACEPVIISSAPPTPELQVVDTPDELRTQRQAERAFAEVVKVMEPLAERECRNRTRGMNCDFRILVDTRRGQPPNAFQTLDKEAKNQPVIVFNSALIADARNVDELAFVMGHEAAHHIQGHIQRQRLNAQVGAELFSEIAATLSGGNSEAVEIGGRIGQSVGARSFSKEFELEADELGTILTARAGYDPVVGAQFFNRIPDPGNRFLGTHPPNAQRIALVRRTAAGL